MKNIPTTVVSAIETANNCSKVYTTLFDSNSYQSCVNAPLNEMIASSKSAWLKSKSKTICVSLPRNIVIDNLVFNLRVFRRIVFQRFGFKLLFFFWTIFWVSSNVARAQNCTFSTERADWYFERCSAKQKFIFLSNLIEADFANMNLVEKWFIEKVETWTSMLEEVTETDLEYLLHDKPLKISDLFVYPLSERIISKWGFYQPSKKILASAAYILILEKLDFGSIEKSLSLFKILQNVIIWHRDDKYLLWYYRLYGVLLLKYGLIPKAIKSYQTALLFSNNQKLEYKNSILASMSICYLQVQNYPRARHYILKVLIDCSPSAMPINALNTYGLILDGMGDYDQAIRVHRYVLYHAIKKKDVIMELGSYSNLAKVYYNKKDYDKAHFYLNKSDHVALKNDFHYGIDFNRIARSNVWQGFL